LLAELLLDEGYEVFGVAPRALDEYRNLSGIKDRLLVRRADLLDAASLEQILRESEAQEVYNLASVSFVPASWDEPVKTAEFSAVGTTVMLETVRRVDPGIRFYQASSSEIYGEPAETPQTESTPLTPLTPYGVAKAYAHHITRSYRKRYDLHASSGILYNHESPRRPPTFLPRKVSLAASRVAAGLDSELVLGDLEARRDWGYARDYVRAMWLMLQQPEPSDYVIATGETHSVRELADCAFSHLGLDYRQYVRSDEALLRGRAELHHLVGNAQKAHDVLGWRPSVSFAELVELLVDADAEALAAGSL
jgi:GDPmannose 4,6-dehydratase